MRKSEIPFMNRGPALRVIAAVASLAMCAALVLDPRFRSAIPGILDAAIGLICGIGFSWLGWKLALPRTISDYAAAKGDPWRFSLKRSLTSTSAIYFFMFYLNMLCAGFLDWALRRQLGLPWPWFRTDSLTGAWVPAFIGFLITYFLCQAKWYDTLPD